jgi:8-oxo-dGTP pyrophosphatase MutT (NUDIX family)
MPALPGRSNHIRAGVLVPLRFTPEPCCLLTLRPQRLRQHGGEVCFPGGRPEADDADLVATALREANEEIGLSDLRVLGRLSSIPVYTSEHRLEPVVAEVLDPILHPNPEEVERVLEIPLRAIFRRTHIQALAWTWGNRQWLSPVFEVDGLRVFGATAYTFLELLHVIAPLIGRPVPALRTGGLQWADLISHPPQS